MNEPSAPLTPAIMALLPQWVARQRWYAGKGRVPLLQHVGGLRLEDPTGEVDIDIHLLLDESGPTPTTYQVPLTRRADRLAGADTALVARVGTHYFYDAPHDPVFALALLRLILDEGVVTSDGPGAAGAAGHRLAAADSAEMASAAPGSDLGGLSGSRVLVGEQSNTSIVFDLATSHIAGSKPLICKLFRVLHDGENPDVVVQAALSAAGSTRVPASVGYVTGRWVDAGGVGGMAAGHLAFAQEFLPDVEDAWRVALAAVTAGLDFTEQARSLGEATAAVHATLAEAMGTREATQDDVTTLVERMRTRLSAALFEVPALAHHEQMIRASIEAVSSVKWPALQRIHGDYHLGQVLEAPDRGWVLVDFEGEPLQALAERTQPDLALRDVAGMLRSFDFVAGSWEQANPGLSEAQTADLMAWAARARTAFLDGYASGSGRDPREDGELLDALELDKALYEVVYEARNRPTWLAIPTTAVARLSARRGTGLVKTVDRHDLERLVAGEHHNPHELLGPHPHGGAVTVRTLKPLADSVVAETADGTLVSLTHELGGVWVGVLPTRAVPDYRLRVTYSDGIEHVLDEPYRFLPTLGEVDLHLIGEGRHEQLWNVLGAHLREYDGPMGAVRGTSFAVWAPNARAIRLIGDFNQWDGSVHPMRALGSTGVWELFVPDVVEGECYKFEILASNGSRAAKADPMARATEKPPATASVVTSTAYAWQDSEWMTSRAATNPHNGPMSVYEVHLGSWRQGESYRELADHLVDYVRDLGFTHIELMPVMEHPYGPSWGYQVTGYYAPTSRFGSPDDFRYLVDTMHRNGIGVLLDWVPGHFPKDAFGLARFDGQALYEHPDPRRGDQPDWGTHVFDFGRPQVRNFLVANAIYWLQEFHADGLRIDAVASMLYHDYSREDGEWLPNIHGGRENLEAVELLQETNATVYRRIPGVVVIAEESTSWPGVTRATDQGGLGFGLKWNMGWMHDSLEYMSREPVYRQHHHHELTFSLVYAWSENFVLPISHDEVVHGKGSLLRKMPGDRWQQLANLRAYLAYQWSHPGKQLIFMGSEFAQVDEWADGRSLEWGLLDQPAHYGIHALVKDLNAVYRSHPALWQLDHVADGFAWVEANDAAGNTFAFLRFGTPDPGGRRLTLASIINFSGGPRNAYRVGLPHPGRWNEILNTDSEHYGGSGVGNLGSVVAEAVPWHGQPYSALLTVPPLGAVWLEPDEVEAVKIENSTIETSTIETSTVEPNMVERSKGER
jgi:1,4-alpha-glucan branching enzyme